MAVLDVKDPPFVRCLCVFAWLLGESLLHPRTLFRFVLAAVALHKNNPNRAVHHMMRARKTGRSRVFADMASAFHAFGGSKATIAYLDGNLDLDWAPWSLHKYLVRAFIEEERLGDALHLCEALRKKEEPDISNETYDLNGFALKASGDYARAATLYRQALVAFPDDTHLRLALSGALWYQDDIPAAYDECAKAYDFIPETVTQEGSEEQLRVWLAYSARLEKYGDYERASDAWRRATLCSPEDVMLRYRLASALIHTGDQQGALKELEAVLTQSPGFEPATVLLAHLSN